MQQSPKTVFVSILVVALFAFGLSLYNKTHKPLPSLTPIVQKPIALPQPVAVGNAEEVKNLIVVDSPKPNDVVGEKISVLGKARGYWYFEATFPYLVEDANGIELASGAINAKEEWMTENFVNFSVEIILNSKPATKTGKLILKKDNPSGNPKFDEQLVIPIRFEN